MVIQTFPLDFPPYRNLIQSKPLPALFTVNDLSNSLTSIIDKVLNAEGATTCCAREIHEKVKEPPDLFHRNVPWHTQWFQTLFWPGSQFATKPNYTWFSSSSHQTGTDCPERPTRIFNAKSAIWRTQLPCAEHPLPSNIEVYELELSVLSKYFRID